MRSYKRSTFETVRRVPLQLLAALLLITSWVSLSYAVPVQTAAPIIGEIEGLTITNPADHWSGGTMTVGGQVIIIPANLLINLPNDYQTLQELYLNAPAACAASGIGGAPETGLAKSDACNARVTGANVSILANVTDSGNVIAGQVDIFKALESVNGNITYIDPTQGYFRVNGTPGSSTTGVMVRVNDPTSRHTIQTGLGCEAGTAAVNCSADTRFKIDPDNYTFAFITGYPACIPGPGILPANCLDANRPAVLPTPLLTATAPVVAADSRHFAPIKLGDAIKADGNFETVAGITFLSASSVRIFVDLTTRTTTALGAPDPTQPDYLIITEAGWDGPAYPASRVRGRYVTNASLRTPPTDIDYFSVHYDQSNAPHEQILYTTQFNKQQGAVIVNAGTGVYDSQIRFSFFPPNNPDGQAPCTALRNGVAFDPKKFTGNPVFPASYFPAGLTIADYCTSTVPGDAADVISNYKLMAPIFREVMARSTRQQVTGLNKAIDIHGNPSQSGQYKLPVTIAYGAFEDINLGMSQFPVQFSGNPFLLDRRLSPNGCFGGCEGTQQPLTPFPFEGINPDAIVANFGFAGSTVPVVGRMFAFMDSTGKMTGTLTWPPANPPAFPIVPTPALNIFPPLADEDAATTTIGVPVIIDVLANDVAVFGTIDTASVKIATGPNPVSGSLQVNPNGTITYTPTPAFTVGTVTFTYTVANNFGSVSLPGTVTVTILGPPTIAPTPVAPTGTGIATNAAFVFTAVPGATAYKLYYENNSGVGSFVDITPVQAGCVSGTGVCSYTLATPFTSATTYNWLVSALNAAGPGPWSATINFVTVAAVVPAGPPATPPTAISPIGPNNLASAPFIFSAVPGATGYKIYYENNNAVGAFTDITSAQAGCASGTGVCSYTPATPFTPATTFNWLVAGQNTNGLGPWSATLNFITSPATPATPTAISPVGTGVLTNAPFTFSAVPGATGYLIYAENNSAVGGFVSVSAAQAGCPAGTGTCSYTPATPFTAATTYNWLVAAQNLTVLGGFSATLNFVTQ